MPDLASNWDVVVGFIVALVIAGAAIQFRIDRHFWWTKRR